MFHIELVEYVVLLWHIRPKTYQGVFFIPTYEKTLENSKDILGSFFIPTYEKTLENLKYSFHFGDTSSDVSWFKSKP